MTSKTPIHMCKQEGAISELKAKITIMDSNANKVENKIDDILTALHKNNADLIVKNTELYSSFKSIEAMLVAEVAARATLAEGQQKISENINKMSERVNNIEHDVSNIKNDLIDTKKDIKQNNEVLTVRVSHLEKVFGYVYAFGAVIVAITLVVIYGNQLFKIIVPDNRTKVVEQITTDN